MLKCAVCEAVNSNDKKLLQCSACKSVAYCSINHQKQDWPNHRHSCSLISIQIQQVEVEDEKQNESGKKKKEFKTVAVAPRDFKQGEIILDEMPLLNIPVSHCCGPAATGFDSFDIDTDLELYGRNTSVRDRQCLTCGVIVLKPHQKCSTCSAPICSSECEKAFVHAKNECAVFSSFASGFRPLVFGKHSGGEKNCPMKKVILIRIESVKRGQPEVWEAVKSLVNPKLKFKGDYEMLQWLIEYQGFLHIDTEVSETKDMESKTEGSFAKIACLYKIGGQIEHSCAPNCAMSLGNFPDFKMRVWAAVPIKKGEIINICRLPGQVRNLGTIFRRRVIRRFYNYTCQCKMCSDVTECGSFQSAVTCIKCQDSPVHKEKEKKEDEGCVKEEESEGKLSGYLLPVTSDAGAKWKCGGCGMEKTENGIVTFIERLQKWIRTRDPFDFVDSHSGKVLHPNHFLIHKTLRTHAASAIDTSRTVDAAEIYKLLDASRYLRDIYNKTQPGISSIAVEVELGLAGLLMTMLTGFPLPERPSAGHTNKLLKMAKECEESYQKGLLFHQNGSPPRGEKKKKIVEELTGFMELLKSQKQKILLG